MYGKNILMKQENNGHGVIDVNSIFYTIQGEGPHAGRPALFVRLRGCVLACSFCDTEFDSHLTEASPEWLLDMVRSKIGSMSLRPLIVLTGGEPMRQNLLPFITLALAAGYEVQIETAGVHWDPELLPHFRNRQLSLVCSPKTAKVADGIEDVALAFKYIIDADEPFDVVDGLPSFAVSQRGQTNKNKLYRAPWVRTEPERIFVQPMDPEPGPHYFEHGAHNRDRCVELALKYGYRLSLQQHKILGLE